LLENALSGIADRQRLRIEVEEHAAAQLLFLPPRAMAQALRGVVENAQQASPSDSQVRVWAVVDDDRLRIEVRDEGTGMTPDVLARAGEPFYTTKQPGQGMGLGLFVARAVLERLGGKLELNSVALRGTTALLTVPLGSSSILQAGKQGPTRAPLPATSGPRGVVRGA
jgi:two-component system sensor histidine kinase RegB